MSFYNIFGEEISEESILTDLISYYNTLHDENKTKITDFNEGSEVRTLLEVMSHLAYSILEETDNISQNHYVSTAEGEFLDLIGENYKIEREQGSSASGFVRFSLIDPTETAIATEQTIEAGTVVTNDDNSYETEADAIIGIGETYTYANVICTLEGADGNCKANTINTIEDYAGTIPMTVTNEEAFDNGADFEDDEEYRVKLLEYIRLDNFGSRGYYENLLLNIDGVHDIKQMDIADTDLYTIAYYINSNKTDVPMNEVYDLFSQPDMVALGHTYHFRPSNQVPINITVDINSDCGLTENEIKDIITTYFAGGDCTLFPYSFEGFNIGDEFNTDQINNDIKNLNESISYLSITVDYELAPAESLVIESIEVNYE